MLMFGNKFKIESSYKPSGDQPEAISQLVDGIKKGFKRQTLLGATGTGKTFTMANIIEQIQKPTLVIAHNKTLAAQLASEFERFFPNNAVHYFVSYYDYYQPEAYIPTTDTFIEKDAQINKEIDRLRHASTQSLLTRKDVIIVASVSCIYGLGSPAEYEKMHWFFTVGDTFSRQYILERLIKLHYERTTADLEPGKFRIVGNNLQIMPVSELAMYTLSFNGQKLEAITELDPVTSVIRRERENLFLFPAKHFISAEDDRERAINSIKTELEVVLKDFQDQGKLLEYERLKRRTNYDLAMIREVGYCSGIENYSRHLSGKMEGEPPETLLSYFPHKKDGSADFMVFIDESHVTLPQLQGMYAGDASRKGTLVEHGFRLPSAKDNRPLRIEEFRERVDQVIYVSATPSKVERAESERIAEQIIRPTGLIDPELVVRGVVEAGDYPGQVHDFIREAVEEIKSGRRVLATTLTKKMAEDLSSYLKDKGMKAEYLHSDVETLDRIKILTRLRKGEIDCLVGVNLLREGLDLPEVSLIGILDADKEGFLRSETSLIQTIGRAARNIYGRVILYADKMTNSLERAITETKRRREVQMEYNKKHGITPTSIEKNIHDITEGIESERTEVAMKELEVALSGGDAQTSSKIIKAMIKERSVQMNDAVAELDFETAAILRDEIKLLAERLETVAPGDSELTLTRKKRMKRG